MIDYYEMFEALSWLVLALGWVLVALVAIAKLGGKGAWFFLVGAVLSFFAQLGWTINSLTSVQGVGAWLGDYDSWSWMAFALLSMVTYALMGAGVFLIIIEAAGRKSRVADLERMGEAGGRT